MDFLLLQKTGWGENFVALNFLYFVNKKKTDIESKRQLNVDIDGVHSIACKHIEYQWHISLSCIWSFRTNYVLSPVPLAHRTSNYILVTF